MSLDLMIVDDCDIFAFAVEGFAKLTKPSLEVIKFNIGVQALIYLRSNVEDLPRGYLIDMRLPGSYEEQNAPLEIYLFLKERGRTKYFSFYTANLSEHDLEVQRITKASVILKSDTRRLERFLTRLTRT
ncbi:hypothetical protein J4216_06060 [Candidatus Woesearchaeota archaeon]|nr:hypothetical protein [Candidatus Woesearchaeota archaeon]